jgi:hypothetical protein
MKRISKITIKRMTDTDPDTSYLGEYSNLAKTDYAIDRRHSPDCPVNAGTDGKPLWYSSSAEQEGCDCGERGDMERNEYRYFNGNVENYAGESPEDIRNYVRQDYERMERLQHGDWCYIGIQAEAEILIPPGSHSIVQEITSGGLWGVESDSDKDYLAEIETEQLSELREQLRALGFSARAVSTAFRDVSHENV